MGMEQDGPTTAPGTDAADRPGSFRERVAAADRVWTPQRRTAAADRLRTRLAAAAGGASR
jgi:hypothetical protein